ncbi:hypothetical protein BURMUCF1_1592 [Burkholderia multivorans ATCC BAA-247]|nr:hypothetical protein BURMUCF1_1592 [Burkholderia multivorans ATCC BAA-247]
MTFADRSIGIVMKDRDAYPEGEMADAYSRRATRRTARRLARYARLAAHRALSRRWSRDRSCATG